LLYSFNGNSDGGNPNGLVADDSGNLYGTAGSGGDASDCGWEPPFTGCGVAFKLSAKAGVWTETVLHTFVVNGQQHSDGAIPQPGPIFGKAGLLYGATMIGGTGACYIEKGVDTGCGTVYELVP